MRSGQPVLVTDNEDNKPSMTMHNSKLTHLLALMDEVTYLKTQIEGSGTGQFYTKHTPVSYTHLTLPTIYSV